MSAALTLFHSFLFISLFLRNPISATTCPTSCTGGGGGGPRVNFPFGLNPDGNTTGPCSYPGFGLACSNQTHELVINLPESGQFVVRYIDYESRQIWLDDPDSCLPQRFLNSFNISGTPLNSEFWLTLTFFNCSAPEAAKAELRPIMQCLSDQNYSVVASQQRSFVELDYALQSACRPIRTFTIPFDWLDGVRLEWNEPDCRSCVESRGDCRFNNRSSVEIGCFDLPSQGGLPRSAKYGIVIGIGIPGILSLIWLITFVGDRVRTYGRRRRRNHLPSLEFSASISPSPAVIITGLDGQKIESYPKTKLGESGRLPKPNDNTCPICLSEYEPKETLRTIPECNHYYHANCIDEWLKVNASCPLCRNSPAGRADELTPPISSSSSSSSSSSMLAP